MSHENCCSHSKRSLVPSRSFRTLANRVLGADVFARRTHSHKLDRRFSAAGHDRFRRRRLLCRRRCLCRACSALGRRRLQRTVVDVCAIVCLWRCAFAHMLIFHHIRYVCYSEWMAVVPLLHSGSDIVLGETGRTRSSEARQSNVKFLPIV